MYFLIPLNIFFCECVIAGGEVLPQGSEPTCGPGCTIWPCFTSQISSPNRTPVECSCFPLTQIWPICCSGSCWVDDFSLFTASLMPPSIRPWWPTQGQP
jgi:hypothetical protein